jgi:hypothetical protein
MDQPLFGPLPSLIYFENAKTNVALWIAVVYNADNRFLSADKNVGNKRNSLDKNGLLSRTKPGQNWDRV